MVIEVESSEKLARFSVWRKTSTLASEPVAFSKLLPVFVRVEI